MHRVDHEQYWFKRRRYGYGWTPVTWQGWTVLGVFIGLTLAAALALEGMVQQNEWQYIGLFLGFIVIELVVLMLVTMRYGPSPKWRWGSKPNDHPAEDW